MSQERKATDYMFGGTHYLNMGMQPIEFAMANGWDAGAFSILKYLSRHATKNGLQDVQKGKHFVELRDEFLEHVIVPGQRVHMGDYIGKNGLTGWTASALRLLEQWVLMPTSELIRAQLVTAIDQLIAEYETEQPPLL